MSTHPITDHATIPFPCWLWDYDTGLWRYAINRIAHQSMMIRGWAFSHYSTNPPDKRPEDVVEDATAPDPLAIAREAAKKVLTEALNFDLRHPDVHREELPAITAIIASAIEQATAALLADNEKLRDLLEGAMERSRTNSRLHEAAEADLVVLRAENERLRAELTALRRDSDRYRYVRQHWDGWWTGTTWHLDNIPEKLDAAIDAAMQEGQP